jgi:hypothetical protein
VGDKAAVIGSMTYPSSGRSVDYPGDVIRQLQEIVARRSLHFDLPDEPSSIV